MSEKDREAFERYHYGPGCVNHDPRLAEAGWILWQAALAHERSSPRVKAMEKVVPILKAFVNGVDTLNRTDATDPEYWDVFGPVCAQAVKALAAFDEDREENTR